MYKTLTIPLKCNKTDYNYMKTLNKLSAEVWNACLEIDKSFQEITGQFIRRSDLQRATKNIVPLHSKGIHHVVHKYLYARDSMWRSIQKKHKNSYNVKLPYKEKQLFVTGWDSQSIHIKNGSIYLAKSKGLGQVRCKTKWIPPQIVQIELILRDKYYLSIKYKEPNNISLLQSENCASIDLGEIHAIVSVANNGNATIITNRKARSIIRLKDKRQGNLKSKQSKCVKDSRQYRKYKSAIYSIKYKTERQINDVVHKQSNLFVSFCLDNNISVVYCGELDSTTRNTKGKKSKSLNHKLNMWCYGKLTKQLKNKLSRYNIKMQPILEHYTSQTCPNCGCLHKPTKRNYVCNDCGYKQHRDIVGAINILNFYAGTNIQKYNKLEYLQIA